MIFFFTWTPFHQATPPQDPTPFPAKPLLLDLRATGTLRMCRSFVSFDLCHLHKLFVQSNTLFIHSKFDDLFMLFMPLCSTDFVTQMSEWQRWMCFLFFCSTLFFSFSLPSWDLYSWGTLWNWKTTSSLSTLMPSPRSKKAVKSKRDRQKRKTKSNANPTWCTCETWSAGGTGCLAFCLDGFCTARFAHESVVRVYASASLAPDYPSTPTPTASHTTTNGLRGCIIT